MVRSLLSLVAGCLCVVCCWFVGLLLAVVISCRSLSFVVGCYVCGCYGSLFVVGARCGSSFEFIVDDCCLLVLPFVAWCLWVIVFVVVV